MKATKLIRDKGLKYAKEIVNSAPANATEWNEGFEFECGQSVEVSAADREKYFVDLADLKRLVESLGYISRWGGIERCKKLYFESPFKRDQHIKDLKRYIRDYEEVYQPKCSHGYDVACLICGFGTVNGERVYHNKGKSK